MTRAQWVRNQKRSAQSNFAGASIKCADQLVTLCDDLHKMADWLNDNGASLLASKIMLTVKPALPVVDKYKDACELLILAQQDPDAKVN